MLAAPERKAPVQRVSSEPHGSVIFLGRNLAVGGAERVFVHYVGAMRHLDPIVVLRRREGRLLAALDPSTPVYGLDDPAPRPRFGPHETALEPEPPTGFRPRSIVELLSESRRLGRIVESTGSGLVSSFLMRAHIIALLTKRLFRPDLRVVLNVHEHISESEPYLYPNRLDRWLMRWVVRRLFPHADRIVVVAQSLADDLTDNYGIHPSLVVVRHNPIHIARLRDLATAPAPELDFARGRQIVAGVGRLVHLKGFDLLIEAIAGMPSASRPCLVLVGEGRDRSVLEGLVDRLGVRDSVLFTGLQANPWRLLGRASVLALSSRTEAYPNVIGEAQALGVPVVAAACSDGVREYLDGGRCGLLVEPESARGLADGLIEVLENPELASRLGRLGLERMREFDLPRAARRYEEVLSAELGTESPRVASAMA